MFDWKIILTIIITLGLVVGYLGSNPALSGFFESVSGRLPFNADTTTRNIGFTLTADKYADIDFSTKSPTNLTITGDSEAALKTGTLRTNKTLGIYGFHGSGAIKGNTLTLDGKMIRVELPEITVSVQETVQLSSKFGGLSISNLGVKEIKIKETKGTLVVGDASTSFSGGIDIVAPLGAFEFFVDNNTFKISGKANKISIPSAGISIG